jgi:hypothetical protein
MTLMTSRGVQQGPSTSRPLLMTASSSLARVSCDAALTVPVLLAVAVVSADDVVAVDDAPVEVEVIVEVRKAEPGSDQLPASPSQT